MVLDQRELNKYFVCLAILILLVNSIFFLFNILIYNRIISEKFPSNYVSMLTENQNLKNQIKIHEELEEVYNNVLNEQQLYSEYYNQILSQRSIDQVQLLQDQKEFFKKELDREVKNLKKMNKESGGK